MASNMGSQRFRKRPEYRSVRSAVSCLVPRPRDKNGRYEASRAEKMSGARCKRGAYKLKGAVLLEVDEMVGKQHSPEQISGRLGQQNRPKVSPETIYLHVYRDKKAGGELYKNLRFGHKKRRKRLGTNDKRGKIPNKTMIAERPAVVEAKERFGPEHSGGKAIRLSEETTRA